MTVCPISSLEDKRSYTTNEDEIMQPNPDDRSDELTEQTTPDHSISDVVLSMLKSGETFPESVDGVTAAYPNGTRMYMQLKQWAQDAQQETSREDARNLIRAACAAMLGVPSGSDDERTFGSFRHCTLIRPLRERDVLENIDLDAAVLLLPAPSRPSFRLAHEADLPISGGLIASRTAFSRLVRLLKYWNQVGQFIPDHLSSIKIEKLTYALPTSGDHSPATTTVRTVVGAARHAREEALAVRESIVLKGADHTRDLVANFTGTWLHINPYPDVVNLVTDALLYVRLDDNPGNDEIERRVKWERDYQHQVQRPLTEIQVRHKHIVSLDARLGADGTHTIRTTLAELIPHPYSVNDLVVSQLGTWEDARLPMILRRLTSAERAVALVYANDQSLTWHQAAQACGHDSAFGQRVRCKLKRLGKQLTTRLTARSHVA